MSSEPRGILTSTPAWDSPTLRSVVLSPAGLAGDRMEHLIDLLPHNRFRS